MAYFNNMCSEVFNSLAQKGGRPLDSLACANTVSEVLSADVLIRYVGMKVFIEDENEYYYFSKHQKPDGTISTGVEDSDFQPYSGGAAVDGLEIVDNYSLFTPKTKQTMGYSKNDYIDTININNPVTYLKGFYLYDLTDAKWNYIGINNIVLNNTVVPSTTTVIKSNQGTDYNINSEVTTEQIGQETITISKSLEDIVLDDGVEVHIGDVLEIKKEICGVEVYSYCIVPEEIYDPFA